MDASNMLKPALARGELRCVGATTLNEYRKHIEKDAALERRFQPVYVGEPTVEDTIAILRGLKERYEVHHGVRIQDAALVAAATLSKPLHRRPLPARQGDRPDGRGRLAPADRDRLDADRDRRGGAEAHPARDRAPGAAEGERTRPRRSGWPGSSARSPSCARALGRDEGALAAGEGGDPEASARPRSRSRRRASEVERRPGAATSARPPSCTTGRCPSSRSSSSTRTGSSASSRRSRRCSRRRSTPRTSPRSSPSWTGIPVSRLLEGEMQKLLHVEERLRERVVGQDEALLLVANAVRRARARASATRAGRSARSSSWARPASARPSSPGRSPSSCSTTSTRWCASTCRSTWRSTPWPA